MVAFISWSAYPSLSAADTQLHPGLTCLRVAAMACCAGDVAADVVHSAMVARAFIVLHQEWISSRLGDLACERQPSTARVKIHLVPAAFAKDGKSLGAAFVGEGEGGDLLTPRDIMAVAEW